MYFAILSKMSSGLLWNNSYWLTILCVADFHFSHFSVHTYSHYHAACKMSNWFIEFEYQVLAFRKLPITFAHGGTVYADHCTHDFNALYFGNTLRPKQDGCRFPDDIFRCIFLNENILISINISLKFVPNGAINNIPALVQIMAWRRSDDKPFSEPIMVSLLTHICVTGPRWVKVILLGFCGLTWSIYP